MTPTRFYALFDLHVGTDIVYSIAKNDFVKKPTEDKNFITAVMEKIKNELKNEPVPPAVILGGDQFDFAGLSKFNKDSTVAKANEYLEETYCTFDTLVLRPLLETGTEIIWIQGNHDDRVVEHIKKYPSLKGLIEPWVVLKLKEKCKLIERGGLWNLGKLWFCHGDNIPYAQDIAKAASVYHRNVRFGHFHTYRAYTIHSPIDAKDVKTCISCPSMCAREPVWGKNKPNHWIQGYLHGDVTARGNFSDNVVIRTPEGLLTK